MAKKVTVDTPVSPIFDHETALTELGLDYNKLPLHIKGSINRFKQRLIKYNANPTPKELTSLKVTSAAISDELTTYYNDQLPDNVEPTRTAEEMAARKAEFAANRLKRKSKNQEEE